MKLIRRTLLVCSLIGSFGPPLFFLVVKHYQLERETADWMVSLWPSWASSVALEDRRSAVDLVIGFGEDAADSMLKYSAVVWGVLLVFAFMRRNNRSKRRGSGI